MYRVLMIASELVLHRAPALHLAIVGHPALGDRGVYAPHAQGRAFCRQLAELALDPERCDRLAEAGRRRVMEELSWKRAARQLMGVYEAVGAKPSLGSAPATDPVAA